VTDQSETARFILDRFIPEPFGDKLPRKEGFLLFAMASLMISEDFSEMEPINRISNCQGQEPWTPEQRPENELPIIASCFILYTQEHYGLQRGACIAEMAPEVS
jgi:hypothetical protein